MAIVEPAGMMERIDIDLRSIFPELFVGRLYEEELELRAETTRFQFE